MPGESAEAQAAEAERAPLPYTLAGVGDKTVRKLVEAGLMTVEAVAAASVEQLSEISGIGGKTAEKILAAARGDTAPASDQPS
jgi:Holliday junction resolvasome RuvABC DNA-binding subunit